MPPYFCALNWVTNQLFDPFLAFHTWEMRYVNPESTRREYSIANLCCVVEL